MYLIIMCTNVWSLYQGIIKGAALSLGPMRTMIDIIAEVLYAITMENYSKLYLAGHRQVKNTFIIKLLQTLTESFPA